ncbi:MAG: hypothetical protein R2825_27490 [Saprospiraceae bacterium]
MGFLIGNEPVAKAADAKFETELFNGKVDALRRLSMVGTADSWNTLQKVVVAGQLVT